MGNSRPTSTPVRLISTSVKTVLLKNIGFVVAHVSVRVFTHLKKFVLVQTYHISWNKIHTYYDSLFLRILCSFYSKAASIFVGALSSLYDGRNTVPVYTKSAAMLGLFL